MSHKKIISKLFIEKDYKDNHEVVIRIGPFDSEQDAVHSASYIYCTQNLDISDVLMTTKETLH